MKILLLLGSTINPYKTILEDQAGDIVCAESVFLKTARSAEHRLNETHSTDTLESRTEVVALTTKEPMVKKTS